MKPVEQMCPHNEVEGVFGDCFRAVIASLLEMEAKDVPHFLHDGHPDAWRKRLSEFLKPYNLCFMSFNASGWDMDAWRKEMCVDILYHEISDRSPRFPSLFHSVVGCNGKVVHDPHPDKTGLPEETSERTFGVLIRLQ